MKSLILGLILSLSLSLGAQIQHLEYSNYLLIGPESYTDISPELVHYYFEEYTYHKEELESKYLQEREIKKQEALLVDIKHLDEILSSWNDENEDDKTIAFLNQYDKTLCYELTTSNGIVQSGDFSVMKNEDIDPDKDISFVERINMVYFPRKEEWVRKKISENCESMNPEDCYTTSFEIRNEHYVLKTRDTELTLEELPVNYQAVNKQLIEQTIDLLPFQLHVVEKKSELSLEILSWKEINCTN